jgi:hypothetical protein
MMPIYDNTTNAGLLLRHGDLLGSYYSGPHEEVRAVGFYMPVRHFKVFIDKWNAYLPNIESAVYKYHDNKKINDKINIEKETKLEKPSIYDDDIIVNLDIQC